MTQLPSRERLERIIESANGVLTALAGTNDDVSPNDSRAMCNLWDNLNDTAAPPETVKALAAFALSVLDAEPVAWIVHGRTGDSLTTDGDFVANAEGMSGIHSTPLYATPQPAVTGIEHIREIVAGMSVSVDVSTCDSDAGHRYFGTVTEVSALDSAKHGVILLVQDAEANFETAMSSIEDTHKTAMTFDEWTRSDVDLSITLESETYMGIAKWAWEAGQAALLNGNSPAIPDGWIPCSELMPDPSSEQRVCVYTPTPHDDMRYRFVPASLFKTVCRDATHWYYMTSPKLE